VVLLRKFPKELSDDDDASRAKIKDLDLSGCELLLTDVTLHGFSAITKLSLKGNQIRKLDGTGLDSCEQLRELDVSDNRLKDFRDVTTLVNNLRRLTHVWLDGNVAWGGSEKRANDYNPDGRIRFCTEVSRLHEPGAALRFLNGYKILIRERATAVQKLKLYDAAALEQFRLDLLAEDRKRDGKEDAFVDTSPTLDLSQLGLVALTPVIDRVRKSMPNLQKLDLRGNNLVNLQDLRALLDVCFKLTALDLRDNDIKGDMAQLLRLLKTCPGLRLLWIDNSLRKNMAEPKKYADRVFKELPVLSEVDGVVHPHRQRVKHRFENADPAPIAKAPESDSESESAGSGPGASDEELPSYDKVEKEEPEPEPTVPDRWGDDDRSSGKKDRKSSSKSKSDVVPDRWAAAPPESSSDEDELPNYDLGGDVYSPQNTGGGDDFDFTAAFAGITGDDYLPKNYNETIGRKYDLGKLTSALAQMRDEDEVPRQATVPGWSDSDEEVPDYESDDGGAPKGRWD
jgi:Leucine Rich repeat